MNEHRSELDPLGKLAESFLARYRRGEKPRAADYAAQHPELAEEINELFPALIALEEVGDVGGTETGPSRGVTGIPPVPSQLGEYRIVREVGRGGMGVVYEAVQESLGRHVALKVLPGHTLFNPNQLERFRREARAAGRLHHTNIVPVFGVGEHQGTHYFAMQFIQGHGLDVVLRDLKRFRGAEQTSTQDSRDSHTQLINQTDAEYYRSVARLGVQAAEALQHAHQQGILHRDIKPSNLLLDVQGNVWITDFGLAKADDSADLTHTGDVVGTLRYMAPERFAGQADPRTDVYSLGLTLYELLTLVPAFQGKDRANLEERVRHEDPPPPRQRAPHLPRDLETVVLKAIAKEPPQRYATAAALAEDLHRFLEDRPILARRARLPERTRRWCRRNPARATFAAAALLLVAVGFATLLWFFHVQAEKTARGSYLERQITDDLDHVEKARHDLHRRLADPALVHVLLSDIRSWKKGVLDEAEAAYHRARTLANGSPELLSEAIAARLHTLGTGVETDQEHWQLAKRLDEIRLAASAVSKDEFDFRTEVAAAASDYTRAFADAGFAVEAGDATAVAANITDSPLRYVLTAHLDYWGGFVTDKKLRSRLFEIAGAADPEPWRRQLRELLVLAPGRKSERHARVEKLQRLAKNIDFQRQPPHIIDVLSVSLHDAGGNGAPLLRAALAHYPGDFWLHFVLGNIAQDPVEAAGHLQAALALRPGSMVVHHNLGFAYKRQYRLDLAITHYHKALDINANYLNARINLSAALTAKKDLAGALEQCQRALAINPKSAKAHCNMGIVLKEKKEVTAALDHLHKAIDIDPDDDKTHLNLGNIYHQLKKPDLAMAHCQEAVKALTRRNLPASAGYFNLLSILLEDDLDASLKHIQMAIKLSPKEALLHFNLGVTLDRMGDLKGAIDSYRKAVNLDANFLQAQNNLGIALRQNNEPAAAITHLEKALEIDPQCAEAHNNLGGALFAKGDQKRAIEHCRKALEINKEYAGAWYNLGYFTKENDPEGAITHFKKALELNGEFADAHGQLGLALWGKKDLKKAEFHLREAVRLYPKTSRTLAIAHYNLGTLLNNLDNPEAVAHLREAIQRDPNHAQAHCNLGHAFRKQGKFLDALEYFRRGDALGRKQPDWPYPSEQWVQQCQELLVRQLEKENPEARAESLLKGALTADQRRQAHEVNLKAGKIYVIQMNSQQFDTFLYLHDAKGQKLADNDDISPKDLNSRIVFRPQEGGAYRLVAASFQQRGTGEYTLSIKSFILLDSESGQSPLR